MRLELLLGALIIMLAAPAGAYMTLDTVPPSLCVQDNHGFKYAMTAYSSAWLTGTMYDPYGATAGIQGAFILTSSALQAYDMIWLVKETREIVWIRDWNSLDFSGQGGYMSIDPAESRNGTLNFTACTRIDQSGPINHNQ